jgi:hypothetical protein
MRIGPLGGMFEGLVTSPNRAAECPALRAVSCNVLIVLILVHVTKVYYNYEYRVSFEGSGPDLPHDSSATDRLEA